MYGSPHPCWVLCHLGRSLIHKLAESSFISLVQLRSFKPRAFNLVHVTQPLPPSRSSSSLFLLGHCFRRAIDLLCHSSRLSLSLYHCLPASGPSFSHFPSHNSRLRMSAMAPQLLGETIGERGVKSRRPHKKAKTGCGDCRRRRVKVSVCTLKDPSRVEMLPFGSSFSNSLLI